MDRLRLRENALRAGIVLMRLALLLVVANLSEAQTDQTDRGRTPDSAALGGAVTIEDEGPHAFGFPGPPLDSAERRQFAVGNSFFRQNWVIAPSSAAGRDGLGPLFNSRSCSGCHLRDGRSRPPAEDEPDRGGLLMRVGVAVPGGPDRPHPRLGGQIQDSAIPGFVPEARIVIEVEPVLGFYGDGEPFELLRPRYRLTDREPEAKGVTPIALGPRVAPQLIGLGLLEAIPEAAILAREDPDDRDQNGISGRAHRQPDPRGSKAAIGRFGWKATTPNVETQTVEALAHDMGITSKAIPAEPLTALQRNHYGFDSDPVPEIDELAQDRLVFYTRALAVPAQRRRGDRHVIRGEGRFLAFGCAECHVTRFETGPVAFHPGWANQTIRPYTDLLLHDLGDGLSDGKWDGDARPGEWKTPPLWGIGLIPAVNGHSRYLHDGRARSLAEAILWHGGEAQRSREAFRLAGADDRQALVTFLNSL